MDSFYFVIVLTLAGFLALAAALLVPVYLFLKKEERTAKLWTEDHLRKSSGIENPDAMEGSVANGPADGNRPPSDHSALVR